MNLGKQIDSLLKRNPSVYVKGLGVFQRIHTPATFDSKRNVFLPPISFVEFDHFETEGYDFLTYLQQIEHLERSEAEAKLAEIISEIEDKVVQDGEVELDSLGTLISYGHTYVFKPLDLSGFLYSEFDNEYVPIEEVREEVSNDEEIIDTFEEEVIVEEEVIISISEEASGIVEEDPIVLVDPTEENQDLLLTDEEVDISEELIEEEVPVTEESLFGEIEEKPEAIQEKVNSQSNAFGDLAKQYQSFKQREDYIEPEPKERNSYIYGLVAALVMLITGAIFYYAMFYKSSSSMDTFMENMKPVLDSSWNEQDKIDSVLLVEPIIDTAIIEEKDTVVTKVVESAPLKEAKIVNHKYIIVIGTHATIEQAEAEVKKYNQEGHKSVRVLPPNLAQNKKRVVWDTYPTREQRDSAMRIVREKYKADAWGAEIK